MTGNSRRPPITGSNRMASSRSSLTDHIDRATVINATALPRSLSYNNTIMMTNAPATTAALASPYDRLMDAATSSDDRRSRMDALSLALAKDSLARDPFVSISRAIQTAKLRAGASLRTMAAHNKHNVRPTRYRSMYIVTKRVSRVLSLILFLLIVIFIIMSARRSFMWKGATDVKRRQNNASFWSYLWSLSRSSRGRQRNMSDVRQLSSLEYEMRHRPSAYNLRSLTTGPWLIALVADLDKDSCRERSASAARMVPASCLHANAWVSFLKRGVLDLSVKARVSPANKSEDGVLTWLDEMPLENVRPITAEERRIQSGNRGMELSELTWFNGHLMAPDDRTGALLEIASPHGMLDGRARKLLPFDPSSVPPSVLQRTVLRDGDGSDDDGAFKAEWMVVKDEALVVGGHGRPYTDARNGAMILSTGPTWVKSVSRGLELSHGNWSARYDEVASSAGVRFPGYLMHEAVLWSHERREWIFLPRRRSEEPFDAQSVMKKGWNGLIVADEKFVSLRRVVIKGLSDDSGLRGFSSAKFVPGSKDRLVAALRTIEIEKQTKSKWSRRTASYMSVFDVVTGDMVMEERKVSNLKYEGLAFL